MTNSGPVNQAEHVGYYTLAGDVNNDMVQRVFCAVAEMSTSEISTAHLLVQSHGGFISDGLCLYNFLSKLPIRFVTYNAGAVASIAVIVFLAGRQRYASDTARFMVHKSHASPQGGARPDALQIIADGLKADDRRTETILRRSVRLTDSQWAVHAYSDLHLTAEAALVAGMIDAIGDFSPPPGVRIVAI
ncbi:MAG: ATP-dependent Clp protease proteolytic subunit [Herminiimonas sp.]|nr:ATP-dependent Clp protease proteolytic subunit [Herminiimonas sp.]